MSIILITGGIRSGKSAYAEKIAEELGGDEAVIYFATGQAWDDEMRARIDLHQVRRPEKWGTVEEPMKLVEVAERLAQFIHEANNSALTATYRVVLLDTLSGWIANLLMSYPESEWGTQQVREKVTDETARFVQICRDSELTWVIVSDEVGLGGVAGTPLGRAFQDVVGRANQLVADVAERFVFVISGQPMYIKGGKGG